MVESNGGIGIGTTTLAEKAVFYNTDTTQTLIQYGNSRSSIGANRGFVTGVASSGAGMVWHRESLPISFGTSNVERMRINADGTTDWLNTARFTADNPYGAAVFINQVATVPNYTMYGTAPILRLSSGTAAANQNVKFSFENNGNLGIGLGETGLISERLVLYNPDTVQVFTQYGNRNFEYFGANRGFVTGIASSGKGIVWHRESLPISFGTDNKERMRINADGTTDLFGTIRSASGGFQIDTTGLFQAKSYRTKAGNLNYHQFTTNNTTNAAVYINQEATSGPILRLSSGTANADQNVKFSFENNGNFGIGTTSPAEKLSLYTAGNTKVATQYGNGTGSGFTVGMESNGSASVWHTAGQPITFGTSNAERMRINADGNVGIGTVSPEYKLDVVGNIRAYSVQISTAKTADFVFDEDYRLRPLSEVESYIAANKHLPEIAPAAEMKEKGLDMGDMQIKLLQKVEELTLYVIQQQKEIEELKRLLNEKK